MNPYEPVGWGARHSTVGRFLPALAIIAAVIAVGAVALGGGTLGPSAAPFPPSPLVGVVTSVDSTSLTNVIGFDLLLADGTTVKLALGQLENATQFSPSHLMEHQATSVPIRAFYRLQDGTPVVYRLEDATPAAT